MKKMLTDRPVAARMELYLVPPSSLAMEATMKIINTPEQGREESYGKEVIPKDVLHQPAYPSYKRRDTGITEGRVMTK